MSESVAPGKVCCSLSSRMKRSVVFEPKLYCISIMYISLLQRCLYSCFYRESFTSWDHEQPPSLSSNLSQQHLLIFTFKRSYTRIIVIAHRTSFNNIPAFSGSHIVKSPSERCHKRRNSRSSPKKFPSIENVSSEFIMYSKPYPLILSISV
jgi:hypothetical protein